MSLKISTIKTLFKNIEFDEENHFHFEGGTYEGRPLTQKQIIRQFLKSKDSVMYFISDMKSDVELDDLNWFPELNAEYQSAISDLENFVQFEK